MSADSEESLPQMRLSNAQRQLSIVQAQMKGYTREAKLQALTAEQLSGFGCDTRVYKAVGKMFMEENFDDAVADANQKKAEALESYAMLEKKSKFYEKEVAEAQSHLTDLLRSIEHAQTL